ncbi:hypothetical protein [Erythrobacter mangrovi]|uniref:DUF4261 domain-containing protein n=1 Tax=Erythrobacter mangrovi TaxID=2739433 RepID=A0A7D4ATY4_9SPHN|nr:hypothetical protein [Erythrobacter mangrovi]QKG71457.1 hypothetical protein HQR01_08835 [Erythrobacter mangrovi]
MTIAHSFADAAIGQSGLLLLFGSGNRPERSHIIAAMDWGGRTSISHDPAQLDASDKRCSDDTGVTACQTDNWLELQRDGLTFDLVGLSGGPSLAVPVNLHKVGNPSELSLDMVEAIGLAPGPHLAAGSASLPVVRTQLAVAVELIEELPGLVAVCWAAAGTVLPPALFSSVVTDWLAGGAFPARALLHIGKGSVDCLRSYGLAYFTGQEIELSEWLSRDETTATDLAHHLVHELVATGPICDPVELHLGKWGSLRLKPSSDGATVLVEQA